MKKYFLIFFFSFFLVDPIFTQSLTKTEYTEDQKKEANSALNSTYLSQEEKQVIYLCNLARLDGALFNSLYLQPYITDKKLIKNSYVTSLISTLKKQKPMKVLKPEQDLYACAKDHAEKNGPSGAIGHQRYSQRFKKHAPNYSPTAENCDYGNNLGLDIVMSLLIDDGVSGVGHRKNILNPALNSVGVCIYTHKKYKYQCVMDFGTKKVK